MLFSSRNASLSLETTVWRRSAIRETMTRTFGLSFAFDVK